MIFIFIFSKFFEDNNLPIRFMRIVLSKKKKKKKKQTDVGLKWYYTNYFTY